MRHKGAQSLFVMVALLAAVTLAQTPSNNPFPIRNGVLQNDLNANGHQISNLDTSNLGLGGGGGGGIDTGTTTAILKGNGAHGIADAVAGTDYLLPTGSGLLLTGVVLTANNLSDLASTATARTNLGLGNVDNTSDANKPVSTATNTALALKADTSAMTTALAAKADTTYVDTQDATKQNSWGVPAVNGYIAAGNTDGVLFWVDPTTLGTTNASYTDGVENSSTTFQSATAGFTTGDIGKTVVASGLPGGTTISSRISSSIVLLSANATATASGVTFTILNRFQGAGTGTVTLFQSGNLSPLFTTSVSSGSSTPNQSFSLSSAAANTFFGNASGFSATPTFMSASAARTSLGLGTLALQNDTGSSVAIQKGNGTGGLAPTVAGTDYLTPTGSGTGLTGVLKTANNLSDVTAATARTNLGLATVASSGLFGDLTAPVVGTNTFYGNPTGVTGAAVFMTASAARTALSLSTSSTELQKGNGTGGITAAAANQDYTKDTSQIGTNADNAWTSGVTNFIEGAALTANRNRTLPPTSGYSDGSLIKYFDSLTTAAFGPRFLPAGSDTLKGSPAAAWAGLGNYAPFIGAGFGAGSKSISFQKKGTDWEVYAFGGESLGIKSIQNTTNLNGSATFNPNALTAQRPIFMPDAAMVLMTPTDSSAPGVLVDINADGTATKAQQNLTSLLAVEDTIGQAGVTIGDSSHNVNNTGGVDTVRIAGTLNGNYVIKWPSASLYGSGKTVALLDASGSVGSTNPITISASNGTDTFNGQSSFVFDEAYGRRVLTSDGTSNWSFSSTKTSIQPFKVIAPTGSTFTITADANTAKENAHLNLLNGTNALNIVNPNDGMQIELVLIQPASGAAATLGLPIGSYTPNGVGLITLSSANGAIDRLKGSYDGTLGAFLWDAPILNHTTGIPPTAPSSLSATGINANRVDLSWTDNATNETGFSIERALGTSGTGFAQIGSSGPVASSGGTGTYSDTTVSAATGYNYRVRAQNVGGYSSYSNHSSVTTAAGGPTADLLEWHFNEGSGNTAGATIGPAGTVSIGNWTTSTQSGTGAALAPVAGMVNISGLAVTTVGTAGTTTYTYKVLAWKTSAGSHNACQAGLAIATGNAVLSSINYNHVSWTAVTGADYYEVYRTTSAGTPSTVGRLTGTGSGFTATSFDDTGIATNGTTPSNVATSTDITTATAVSSVTYGSQLLTVSFWAKSTYSTTSTVNIVSGGTTVFRVQFTSGNKFNLTFPGTTGTVTGTASNSVTSNGSAVNSGTTWHLIVVELDNSHSGNIGSEIKVYYDGNNAQTVTYTDTSRTGPLTFAASKPVVGANGFVGAIDDVRIYGRLLTTTEIAALFTGNAQ